MTTITALPTPPSRADSTTFSTRGDAFLGALPTFVTEANAVGSEATAAAAAAAASASAAAASQSTASTAAAAVAAQSPVANAAAAAASAAAAAASAAAAAQTSGAVAATTLSASGAVTLAVLTASKPVFTDAGKNLTSTGVIGISEGGTGSTATPTLGGAVYGTGSAYAATAAGTAGQVLTSNGASAPTWQTSSGSSGLRNRIINGAMTIDQRNAGGAQTITAAAALAYTVDRFYAYSTGANVTGQQVAGSLQSQKRYRFTGAASVTAIGFGTRLEAVNTYDLNNKTVTISADIANSLLTTVTWTLFRATTTDDTFGTLAAPTVTSLGTGTFTVTSTVTNYNAQVTLPTAATTGLQLVFTVGAQTSGTWTIGNVQLEIGSTATPFEQRPYGMELALCQRYYFRHTPGNGGQFTGVCWAYGSSNAYLQAVFPVPMRTSPSSIEQSGTATDYRVTLINTATTCTATPSFAAATNYNALVIFTTGATLTSGQVGVAASNSAAGYLGWSAEL